MLYQVKLSTNQQIGEKGMGHTLLSCGRMGLVSHLEFSGGRVRPLGHNKTDGLLVPPSKIFTLVADHLIMC